MTDRRGNTHNFQGCYFQVSGDDEKLNTYLDRLDFVPGCLVHGRRDTTEGQGVLFIQAKKAVVPGLHKMALEDGLAVQV